MNMKTLMLFTTQYCIPCKAFKPIFEEESIHYPSVTFEMYDATDEAVQPLLNNYGVRSVPTIVLVENGFETGIKTNPVGADDIREIIMGER